ncbi:MAG: LamG-like jellyroll fold domain-containing protein [Nitrosopumilaceae archaeon]|nr:LamG-like jellyroll fold domain-containing protein [Nitrosopumilaceae archaeon]
MAIVCSQSFNGGGAVDDNNIELTPILDPNANPGTVACWARLSELTNNFYTLYAKAAGTGTAVSFINARGPSAPSGADSYGTDMGGTLTSGGTASTDVDVWIFLSLTWSSGGSGTLNIYRNGTSIASSTRNPAAASGNCRIGSYMGLNTANWHGEVAHAHFYDTNLSIPQLKQIMYRPGTITSNLLAYYPLWDDSNTQRDLSGNGNDGTRSSSGEVTNSIDGPI